MLTDKQTRLLVEREKYTNSRDLHQNDLAMRRKLKKYLSDVPDMLLILKHLPQRQLDEILDTDALKDLYKLSETVLGRMDPPQVRVKSDPRRYIGIEAVKLYRLTPEEQNMVPLSDGTKSDTFGPSVAWELSPEELNLIYTVLDHIRALRSQITPIRETLPDIDLMKFQTEIIPQLKKAHGENIRARLDVFDHPLSFESLLAASSSRERVETTPGGSEE